MNRPLRIGLVGAGMVSVHHLVGWTANSQARVVAIADPDLLKARQRAAAFDIPNAYADARTMIEREDLDAIDIVSPVSTHAELCCLGAEFQLAIMCQKPLSESAAEARSLLEFIEDAVPFKVHENWRFRPEYRRVKRDLGENRLGCLQRVSLDCSSSGLIQRSDGSYPAIVRQPFFAKLPKLIVFELLIHHLDLITWLFGPVTVNRAALSRRCAAVIGEDVAEIELLTANGVSVRLTGSFCRAEKPEIPTDDLVIVGEQSTLRFSNGRVSLEPDSGLSPESFPFDHSYPASYAGAIKDFVEGLVLKRPFETSALEHLAILNLVEEIYALGGYPGA